LAKGNDALTLDTGNLTITAKQGNVVIKTDAGKITLDAKQGIVLKCGESKVELTQQGIKISGAQVSLDGSSKTEVKGAIVDVKADGMVKVNGSMVKIN